MPDREAGLWERQWPHGGLLSHQGSEDGTAAGLLHGMSQGCGELWVPFCPPSLPGHLTSGGLEEQVAQGPPGLTHHQLGSNCSTAPQVSFLGQGRQSSLKRAEKRRSRPPDVRIVMEARKGM